MQHATSTAPRYDIYAIIHKALRNFMFDTLARVGSLDHDDTAQVQDTLAQVRQLMQLCRTHLEKEDRIVHAAMEARCPGSTVHVAADHAEHELSIIELQVITDAAGRDYGAARLSALRELYRHLALFIGENLLHMDSEETDHNEVLWSAYSDAELVALEQEIVAATAPEEMMLIMRWMLAGMTRQERAAKLAEIRAHAPAPVFAGLMALAGTVLSAGDQRKLASDLGMPMPLAA